MKIEIIKYNLEAQKQRKNIQQQALKRSERRKTEKRNSYKSKEINKHNIAVKT